ncbi:MAG: tetratricopeptide repeat protein [Methyloceanibacter sp.]
MLPRQSFRLKPVGGFRAAKVLWLAALLLAFFFGFGLDRGLQAAPLQPEPKPGLVRPEQPPADKAGTDTGFDDAVEPNEGGMEEVPLGQAGESPAAPDEELDDNQPLKPDLKPGGEGVGNPQSTEENKQDRLGPKQDNGPGAQTGNAPLLASLDRNKMLGQLYDQLSSAKDLGAARPIMDSIEELWRSSGSDTVDLLLSRVDHFTKDADLDLAGQVLDALADLAPENAEVWHKRARVEVLSNDYTAALADLRRSLNLDPRNYNAISDLGSVLQQVGAKKEALEAYRKALKANPFLDEARDAVKELTREVDGQDI